MHIQLNMEELTIGVLKQIIEHVPDDYKVFYVKSGRNVTTPLLDNVTIDISEKKIIFK